MGEQRKCLLCGALARRSKVTDRSVYEWKCEDCGTWRASFMREQTIRLSSDKARSVLAAQVRKAKADGQALQL